MASARPPATAPIYLPPPSRARTEDLEAAARVLNEGERVAILAGAGALHARDEVLTVADRLGAPVINSLPGKAVILDDSEYAVGGIGLLGTRPGEDLVEDCDTLFMIGTNFPYTQHLPSRGKVRVVQIEADPVRAGLRIPTEVPVIGDARESLQGLIPLLTRKSDRGHLEKYQKEMARWRSDMKVEQAIEGALAFDGPAIVDIDVDPNEPPLPGKVVPTTRLRSSPRRS